MKYSAIRLFRLVPLSLLAACATPVTVTYSPTSTMSLHGSETVGNFEYAPAKQGKLKDNQIQNTAIGSIYIDNPVAKLFGQAFLLESRFVGIAINSGPSVHGTINSFLADDLGYHVDWTLDVTYVVSGASGAAPCYRTQKVLKKRTSKFFNVNGAIDQVIRLNIEELFKDPAFVACINPNK